MRVWLRSALPPLSPCLLLCGPPVLTARLPLPPPPAMHADSSALSRQPTSGPAYLEFPLFY